MVNDAKCQTKSLPNVLHIAMVDLYWTTGYIAYLGHMIHAISLYYNHSDGGSIASSFI